LDEGNFHGIEVGTFGMGADGVVCAGLLK
jgi:hypothetical protein